MAIDRNILLQDQQDVIADLSDTITVAGTDYVVAAGGVQSGQTLDVGGFILDVTFQFTGLPSVIGAIATMNRQLTYAGKNYRIARVFPDNTGAGITCFCVDDAK